MTELETNKRRKLSHSTSADSSTTITILSKENHTILPTTKHTHTIIFLHDTSSTTPPEPAPPQFVTAKSTDGRTLPQVFPSLKWVSPPPGAQAIMDSHPSTSTPSQGLSEQNKSLKASILNIAECVRSETREIGSPERIILGGSGQGCAIAVAALLHGGVKIGGFMGLGGLLPLSLSDELSRIAISVPRDGRLAKIHELFDEAGAEDQEALNVNASSALDTGVFLAHAVDDLVVPVDEGRKLSVTLLDLGFIVKGKEYGNGGHGINEPQGVDDMVAFLLPVIEKKEVRFAVEVENIPRVIPGSLSAIPATDPVVPDISHLIDVAAVAN